MQVDRYVSERTIKDNQNNRDSGVSVALLQMGLVTASVLAGRGSGMSGPVDPFGNFSRVRYNPESTNKRNYGHSHLFGNGLYVPAASVSKKMLVINSKGKKDTAFDLCFGKTPKSCDKVHVAVDRESFWGETCSVEVL